MTQANTSPFPHPAQTWNQRFSKEGYVFGTEPNAWLRHHANAFRKNARVLCVADGEGRNSVWLAKQGHQVEAFDISDVGVAKARKWAQENQVHVDLTVASCDAFAWQADRYDGIAAIFIQFADPALRVTLFRQMVQSLQPGGTLLLLGYTPKQLAYGTGGPSVLSHLYTEALLRESFADMDIQEIEEFETDLAEGEGHKGRSAVIGLVASRRPAPI